MIQNSYNNYCDEDKSQHGLKILVRSYSSTDHVSGDLLSSLPTEQNLDVALQYFSFDDFSKYDHVFICWEASLHLLYLGNDAGTAWMIRLTTNDHKEPFGVWTKVEAQKTLFLHRPATPSDSWMLESGFSLASWKEDRIKYLLNYVVQPRSEHVFMLAVHTQELPQSIEERSLYDWVIKNNAVWTLNNQQAKPAPDFDISDYNQYTFFNRQVHETLFNVVPNNQPAAQNTDHKEGSGLFRWTLWHESKNSPKEIPIFKLEYSSEKFFELELQDLQLQVFSHDVGVLMLHVVNRRYASRDDILNFIERARRIHPPFLGSNQPDLRGKSTPPWDAPFCVGQIAKSIKIEILGSKTGVKDWVNFEELKNHVENNKGQPTDPKVATGRRDGLPLQMFTGLLAELFPKTILHVQDDRMHVVTWAADPDLFQIEKPEPERSNNKDSQQNKEDHSPSPSWSEQRKSPSKLDQQLRRWAFIDPGDPFCSDAEMMEQLLNKALYPRFWDDGTVYGITNYSFMCITKDSCLPRQILRGHTTDLYAKIVLLAVMQKAFCSHFGLRMARLTRHLRLEDKNKQRMFSRLEELRRDYNDYLCSLSTMEVSEQEQPRELYTMIRSQMGLEQRETELREKIDSLHSHYESIHSRDLNRLGTWFLPLTAAFGLLGANLFVLKLHDENAFSGSTAVGGGSENVDFSAYLGNLALNLTAILLFTKAFSFMCSWWNKENPWKSLLISLPSHYKGVASIKNLPNILLRMLFWGMIIAGLGLLSLFPFFSGSFLKRLLCLISG